VLSDKEKAEDDGSGNVFLLNGLVKTCPEGANCGVDKESTMSSGNVYYVELGCESHIRTRCVFVALYLH
jgi:hypothetical protein